MLVARRCPKSALSAAAALLAALACLVAAAPAGAATPIKVADSGAGTSIAVDASGNAHVVWHQDAPEVARYCRLPAGGAPSCDRNLTISPFFGGNGLYDRVLVAASGATVVVLWRECCTNQNNANGELSTDSGGSFASHPFAGPGSPPIGEEAVPTTGDANIEGSSLGWSDSLDFQAAQLGGPAVMARADLFGTVAFAGDSTFFQGLPLMVSESGDKVLSFRRNTGGDPNAEANWTAAKTIPTAGDGFKRPELASDASDAFLVYTDAAGGGPDRPVMRPYLPPPDEFGPAKLVADRPAGDVDIAVDSSGTIHVVWTQTSGLFWSTSEDRGDSFSPPVQLTDQFGIVELDVAAGPPGRGFAAYKTIDGNVWVTPLEGSPAVAPPPAPKSRNRPNRFRFGKVQKNVRRGTARIVVRVPGPGVVRLRGKKVRAVKRRVKKAGVVRLPIRAKGKARKRLRRKGRVRVAFAVSFKPNGGKFRTQRRRVVLVQRR